MMPFIFAAVGDDDGKALHSFRGTLKDMPRNAEATKEPGDSFTGDGFGDVAGDYAGDHSLEKRNEAINKVGIGFLSQLGYGELRDKLTSLDAAAAVEIVDERRRDFGGSELVTIEY